MRFHWQRGAEGCTPANDPTMSANDPIARRVSTHSYPPPTRYPMNPCVPLYPHVFTSETSSSPHTPSTHCSAAPRCRHVCPPPMTPRRHLLRLAVMRVSHRRGADPVCSTVHGCTGVARGAGNCPGWWCGGRECPPPCSPGCTCCGGNSPYSVARCNGGCGDGCGGDKGRREVATEDTC